MSVESRFFDKTADGREVREYTLSSDGIKLSLLDYGATIRRIVVDGPDGPVDVAGGYDRLVDFEKNDGYQGAVIGRYANRIANGRFTLKNKEYQIYQNDGSNSLHGGKRGFDKYVWDAETGDDFVRFSTVSPDGDENYPGKLSVSVTYTVIPRGFYIRYEAETDKTTVINLTNHCYFNLTGFAEQSVLDHTLKLNSSRITPVDSSLIPTGEFMETAGTPFDFSEKKRVGRDIEADHPQLKLGGGYDHNFVIDKTEPVELRGRTLYKAALLGSPDGRLEMSVSTDQPGIQVYTGNFLHDDISFKGGIPQKRRSAICLETQHYPDSPNHPGFPSVTLEPGEKFDSVTLFAFTRR